MDIKIYKRAHPHITTDVDIGFSVPIKYQLSEVLAFLDLYDKLSVKIDSVRDYDEYHCFGHGAVGAEMNADDVYILAKELEDKFEAVIESLWFHINHI